MWTWLFMKKKTIKRKFNDFTKMTSFQKVRMSQILFFGKTAHYFLAKYPKITSKWSTSIHFRKFKLFEYFKTDRKLFFSSKFLFNLICWISNELQEIFSWTWSERKVQENVFGFPMRKFFLKNSEKNSLKSWWSLFLGGEENILFRIKFWLIDFSSKRISVSDYFLDFYLSQGKMIFFSLKSYSWLSLFQFICWKKNWKKVISSAIMWISSINQGKKCFLNIFYSDFGWKVRWKNLQISKFLFSPSKIGKLTSFSRKIYLLPGFR